MPEPPEPPPGWQYGVVMDDGTVWGCGTKGNSGAARQRMRLRYSHVLGPCLLPCKWPEKPDSAPLNQDGRHD